MRFYTTNGPPPAALTPRCTQDHGAAEPLSPTWSPDGTALAWEQADGIDVSPAPDLDTCSAAPGFVIAGATSPDFGLADVPPAPIVPVQEAEGAGATTPVVSPPKVRCIVPKLVGKRLSGARSALKKANAGPRLRPCAKPRG